MNEDAIVVSNLQKIFKIPHEKRNTFFESLIGFYKRMGTKNLLHLKILIF